MGPRSSDRGYVQSSAVPSVAAVRASMGPRSSDRGYGEIFCPRSNCTSGFNGSTVLRPWLWPLFPEGICQLTVASMGPRSSDRGYVSTVQSATVAPVELQWVHGPQTVVMFPLAPAYGRSVEASMGPRSSDRGYEPASNAPTQGPPTASMGPRSSDRGYVGIIWGWPGIRESASMGPRSSDRGYVIPTHPRCGGGIRLQWVHGPQTVVMDLDPPRVLRYREPLQWVHGPQTVVMGSSDMRPYSDMDALQWVHGPQTVVMGAPGKEADNAQAASMGPRSSDRGYASTIANLS